MEPDIAPLAKRLAEENNVNWRDLAGSGSDGRILEKDVLEYLARVMAGEEDLNPTPEPVPEGMEAWPEEDVHAYQAEMGTAASADNPEWSVGASTQAAVEENVVADDDAIFDLDDSPVEVSASSSAEATDIDEDIFLFGEDEPVAEPAVLEATPEPATEVSEPVAAQEEPVAIPAENMQIDADALVNGSHNQDYEGLDDLDDDVFGGGAGTLELEAEPDDVDMVDMVEALEEAPALLEELDEGDDFVDAFTDSDVPEVAEALTDNDFTADDFAADDFTGDDFTEDVIAEEVSLDADTVADDEDEDDDIFASSYLDDEELDFDEDVASLFVDDVEIAAVDADAKPFAVDAEADPATYDLPDESAVAAADSEAVITDVDATEDTRADVPELEEVDDTEFAGDTSLVADAVQPEAMADDLQNAFVTDDVQESDVQEVDLEVADLEATEPQVAEAEEEAAVEEVELQVDKAEAAELQEPELQEASPVEVQGAVEVAAAGAVTVPAATEGSLPLVSYGILLRRHVDVTALMQAQTNLSQVLDQDVPLGVLLLRAAERALLQGDWQPEGKLALTEIVADGVALHSATTGTTFADLLDNLEPDTSTDAFGLIVADMSNLEVDEAVLNLNGPVLALGRTLFDSTEGSQRSSLSLSGDVPLEAGAKLLAAVADLLDAPIKLVV